MTEDLKSQN